MQIYQILNAKGEMLDAIACIDGDVLPVVQSAIAEYGDDITVVIDEEPFEDCEDCGFNDKMVTIHEDEYDSLMDSSLWMQCLEMAGVDNWSGYEIAAKYYQNGGVDDEIITPEIEARNLKLKQWVIDNS